MSPRRQDDLSYVCQCLHVTEDDLQDAIARCDLRSLHDVKHHTGAGDGCTSCHRRILSYLRQKRTAHA
jgi:bacterioferritin-associated ferredoxin